MINRDIHQKQIHGKIEIEQTIEDNEFVTSSLNINSELENSNENFVAKKRDKDLQPTIQVQKLTKAEIEVYKGGKRLQSFVLLIKLKDFELPLD